VTTGIKISNGGLESLDFEDAMNIMSVVGLRGLGGGCFVASGWVLARRAPIW